VLDLFVVMIVGGGNSAFVGSTGRGTIDDKDPVFDTTVALENKGTSTDTSPLMEAGTSNEVTPGKLISSTLNVPDVGDPRELGADDRLPVDELENAFKKLFRKSDDGEA